MKEPGFRSGTAVRALLPLAWAALIAWLVFPALASGARGMAASLSAGWGRPMPGVFAGNALANLVAVALAAAVLGLAFPSGGLLLRFLRARRSNPLWFPASFPLGYGAASTAMLGLLLARLWYVPLLVLAFVVPAALGAARVGLRFRRPPLPQLDAPLKAALILLLFLVPRMLAPETHDDSWTYSLAGPDRWLGAHGLAVLFADYRVHFPMLAELPFALFVAAGVDQGASWLGLFLFLCGAAAAASRAPAGARGWAFLLVTAAATATAAASAKSDGPAAGYVLLAFAFAAGNKVAGSPALLATAGPPASRTGASAPVTPAVSRALAASGRGGMLAAAAMAGLALASKYSAPVAVAWVAVTAALAGRRFRPALLLVLLAAPLPWLAKSWLLTGDPVYPLLGARFAGLVPGLDARVAEAWRAWSHGEPAWKWAASAFGGLATESAAFLFIVPVLLTRRGGPGPILAALAAYGSWFVMMSSTHAARHAFPALAGALVIAAPEAVAAGRTVLPGRASWVVVLGVAALVLAAPEAVGADRAVLLGRASWVAVLAVAAASRFLAPFNAAVWNANPFPYILGMEDRSGFVRRGLTVVTDLERHLASVAHGRDRGSDRLAGFAGGRAVMLVGEQRAYGMPLPALEMTPDGGAGVPWFWAAMGSARGERDIVKRFRQLNALRLAYNPVRGYSTGSIFYAFAWPPAALEAYAGFFGRWMDLEYATPTMDYLHGMFYVYRLRSTPRSVPAFLMHLPGTEGEFYRRAGLVVKRPIAESVRLHFAAASSMPPVGFYLGMAGYAARMAEDYPLALRLYERPWRAGQVEQALLMVYGVCLFKTGRYAEAIQSFEHGRAVYPDLALDVDDYSARARFLLAFSMARRDPEVAARVAAAGLAAVEASPWRRQLSGHAGFLRMTLALAEFRRGRRDAGFAELKAAEQYVPGAGKLGLEQLEPWLKASARMVQDRTK